MYFVNFNDNEWYNVKKSVVFVSVSSPLFVSDLLMLHNLICCSGHLFCCYIDHLGSKGWMYIFVV